MTRPDVEGLQSQTRPRRSRVGYPWDDTLTALCEYIFALEAAWEEIRNMVPDLDATYNAAVARWRP